MYIVYPASGNYGADISGPMWHSRRAGLALHTSSDNGKSWNRKKLIHPGRSAYSDVAIFSDKSLGVLFEGGRVDGYKNIYFAEVLTD
jgi:sialidase-1